MTESVPDLSTFISSWTPHLRGLGHDSTDAAPLHGLALPTANSQYGSVIADENVLAVRDLTLPPYTQEPFSPIARNTSGDYPQEAAL